MMRKGNTGAELVYSANAMTDNRHHIVVNGAVVHATVTAELDVAKQCRKRKVTPHFAQNTTRPAMPLMVAQHDIQAMRSVLAHGNGLSRYSAGSRAQVWCVRWNFEVSSRSAVYVSSGGLQHDTHANLVGIGAPAVRGKTRKTAMSRLEGKKNS
jgi:hypothetical protein